MTERYDPKPSDWKLEGIELLPADHMHDGWYCLARGSMTPEEWTIADTPQEALAKFLAAHDGDSEE